TYRAAGYLAPGSRAGAARPLRTRYEVAPEQGWAHGVEAVRLRAVRPSDLDVCTSDERAGAGRLRRRPRRRARRAAVREQECEPSALGRPRRPRELSRAGADQRRRADLQQHEGWAGVAR